MYDERIREVEFGSFSPLVFSTSGGMGKTTTVVYKSLASLVAEKRKDPYTRYPTSSDARSTSPY